MKKIAFLMALLLLVSCLLLAACDDTDGETSVSSGAASAPAGESYSSASSEEPSTSAEELSSSSEESSETSEESALPVSKYYDENGLYTLRNLGMPEFSFAKKTFTVCVYNNKMQTTFYSDEIQPDLYSGGSALLNEAVRGRNGLIKERYGVEIKAYAVDDVYAVLSKDIMANTVSYDAVMPFAPRAFTMAQNQMLMDLNNFSSSLHFDAPWWDRNAIDTFAIEGKQYFAVGDLSLGQRRSTRVLLYNRTMYGDLLQKKYGDLDALVRNGQWTLDTMIEMCEKVTKDVDDDGFMTLTDRWGMVGTDAVDGFFEAGGYRWIEKDTDGFLTVSENLTDLYAYGDKVVQSFLYGDWYLNTQKYRGPVNGNVWDMAINVFGDGNVLFYPVQAYEIAKVQKRNVEYGVLPYPKASADQTSASQTEYFAPCALSTVSVVGIPVGAEDPSFAAYMLEVLACESGNYLLPTYYSTLMDPAVLTEPGAAELLVGAFTNVNYDLLNLGQIHGGYLFRTIMGENFLDSTEKEWNSVQAVVLEKIREFNESFSE